MGSGERVLLSAYLSTAIVSLVHNIYYSEKSFYAARKQSLRKLKYRTKLSGETKSELLKPYKANLMILGSVILSSIIPFYNVEYTYSIRNNYEQMEQTDLDYYNDVVEYVNSLEDYIRWRNVSIVRNNRDKLKYCPEALDRVLDSEDGELNDCAFKLILRLNGMNYKEQVDEFEKRNNGEC